MAVSYVPCPACRAGFVTAAGAGRGEVKCADCHATFPRAQMGARCSAPGCRRGPAFVCAAPDGWRVFCDLHSPAAGGGVPVVKRSRARGESAAGPVGRGQKRRRAGGHGYTGGDGFVEIG